MTAMSCIAMHEDTNDVYTLSLIYYAYSLHGMDQTRTGNVRNRLWAMAIDEGQTATVYLRGCLDVKLKLIPCLHHEA